MKIRGKLYAIILVLIVGFGISLALLLSTTARANRLKEMELAAVEATRDMYRLTDMTKAILQTRGDLKEARAAWGAALENFDVTFKKLVEHPARTQLPPEVQESIESAGASWSLTHNSFLEIGQIVDDIIAEPVEEIAKKTGVLRMLTITTEKNITGQFVFNLIRLDQKLQVVDLAGRDFLVEILGGLARDIKVRSAQIMAKNRIYSLSIAATVILAAVLFLVRFSRAFAARVVSIESTVRKIASRDLSVRSRDSVKDEIGSLGRHLNESLATLSGFLDTVHVAAHKVEELKESLSTGTNQSASALNQISKNIESIRDQFITLNGNISTSTEAVSRIAGKVRDLNREIDEQSRVIGDSSSSIEEMTASIGSVAKLSNERKERAEGLLRIIREGGEKVGSTNDIIKSISKEIDDVLEIIEIIDNVSDQTNLLSMNAAIESAHAGDAGRGFAVVAEEIRKLAESTSENAARIGTALKSVTAKIREASVSSNDSFRTFEQINQDVKTFAAALSEISGSMDELAEGSRGILGATEKISEVTKHLIKGSEEMEQGTREIELAMKNSEEISGGVVNGISEIDKGAKEILQSIVEINRLTVESRERMEELHTAVDSFKTS